MTSFTPPGPYDTGQLPVVYGSAMPDQFPTGVGFSPVTVASSENAVLLRVSGLLLAVAGVLLAIGSMLPVWVVQIGGHEIRSLPWRGDVAGGVTHHSSPSLGVQLTLLAVIALGIGVLTLVLAERPYAWSAPVGVATGGLLLGFGITQVGHVVNNHYSGLHFQYGSGLWLVVLAAIAALFGALAALSANGERTMLEGRGPSDLQAGFGLLATAAATAVAAVGLHLDGHKGFHGSTTLTSVMTAALLVGLLFAVALAVLLLLGRADRAGVRPLTALVAAWLLGSTSTLAWPALFHSQLPTFLAHSIWGLSAVVLTAAFTMVAAVRATALR
ncbi:hypothetical protein [Nocardia stercoris]|uniref:Uncharacterized protein n=1 Tax=Nocardia stercoris TaxID=2483361 RepID=A0A3M2L3S6_9NOCA|nr:hypothetical protein [Nocardia stercoris]RMI29158.1 hypothetical protein EBN03_27455 [Nocardia stercoris]